VYVTRFAPTPSGPLHFGSLIALTGSWLRARSRGGRFLLRIEDLDAPRCPEGMAERIISEIETLGFDHDGEILTQRYEIPFYESQIAALMGKGLAFWCSCTRKSLRHSPCKCYLRHEPPEDTSGMSVRFKPDFPLERGFDDALLGRVEFDDRYDFLTLKRADGIISYNLACVADDIRTGVTEVVRGQDLVYVTVRQMALCKALGAPCPHYLHLPLAMEDQNFKLSKQNRAAPVLELFSPAQALIEALRFLGQKTDDLQPSMEPRAILARAAARFDLLKVPKKSAVPVFSDKAGAGAKTAS
jgi:glutamyl-Q tRNA(Asp) synthetase